MYYTVQVDIVLGEYNTKDSEPGLRRKILRVVIHPQVALRIKYFIDYTANCTLQALHYIFHSI